MPKSLGLRFERSWKGAIMSNLSKDYFFLLSLLWLLLLLLLLLYCFKRPTEVMIIISCDLGRKPSRLNRTKSSAMIREAMIWRLFHKLRQLNESLAQLRGAPKPQEFHESKFFQKFYRSSVSFIWFHSLVTWSSSSCFQELSGCQLLGFWHTSKGIALCSCVWMLFISL